ncbi:MAG: PE domain-containing protein, partial [Actinomycetota bacterium]
VVDDVVVRVDPRSGEVLDEIVVGTSPTAMAAGEGALWVANFAGDTVTRVDPTTGATETIPVGRRPNGIAVGEGFVWVTSAADDEVAIINPGRNRVVGRISVGDQPQGVAVGFGSVWVVNQNDGTVTRIEL